MNKSIIIILLLGIIFFTWVVILESLKQNRDPEYASINDTNNTTLLFVGDIMLGRNVGDDPFRYVTSLVQSADISSGNLEYAITESNNMAEKKINLKANCNKSVKLKDVGFDHVSIANNHIMDFGERGLKDTIQCLNQLNIVYTGAGTNISEASKLEIVRMRNLSIGFLSFTSISPEYAYATTSRAGVSDIRGDLKQIIAEAKKKTDFLIINTHWGSEYTFEPSAYQKTKAHNMIDFGADLVIGHHPHVGQNYEVYNNRYIFYSLGNFVFDQEHEVTKNAYAIRINLNKDAKIIGMERINIRIDDSTPFITSKHRLI